jgi:hypothetical protein
MDAICFVVAGAIVATLPATEFDIEWQHSVQKTRWSEKYRAEGQSLRLVSAHAEGSGAGMEPGADAWREGNGWRWSVQRRMDAVTLASSPHGDYSVCAAGACRSMRDIVPLPNEGVLTIRSCPRVAR